MASKEDDMSVDPQEMESSELLHWCILRDSSTCDKDPSVGLRKVRDLESWQVLLEAARICNYQPVLTLAENLSATAVPSVYYHAACRSAFTQKKTLQKLKSESPLKSGSHDNAGPPRKMVRSSLSQTTRVYSQTCIFCKRKDKYKKDSRTREPLVQCTELRCDEKIRDVATLKHDTDILAITSKDIVAAEAHYHRVCYREYTRSVPVPSCSNISSEVDTMDDEEVLYSNACYPH